MFPETELKEVSKRIDGGEERSGDGGDGNGPVACYNIGVED